MFKIVNEFTRLKMNLTMESGVHLSLSQVLSQWMLKIQISYNTKLLKYHSLVFHVQLLKLHFNKVYTRYVR